jgi:hypothetical protein
VGVNLLHLFEFYLGVGFLVSFSLRFNQYRSALALIREARGRWPKLFELARGHTTVFLSAGTVLPASLALVLWIIHTLACRLVWPSANLTWSDLAAHAGVVPVLAILAAAMLSVDGYVTFNFGRLDRDLMQRYFDKAEIWLKRAPVVKMFTFGFVNPRQMVATEVQKALQEVNRLLNLTLWWFDLQVGLRFAFGLALWLTYAALKPGGA